jgi:hypothetical protein
MEHPSYEDLTQWCGGRGLPRCLVVGDLVGRELQRVVLHHCNVRPADWAEGVLARSIPSPIPIKVEGRGWERFGFDTTRLNNNGTPQVSYMRDLLGGSERKLFMEELQMLALDERDILRILMRVTARPHTKPRWLLGQPINIFVGDATDALLQVINVGFGAGGWGDVWQLRAVENEKAPSAVCADLLQPKRSARHPGAGGEAF